MKLFKSFRKMLIKEGNLKRYLLYAIGEILLVMIGISLAFQLDNWNEERIKEDNEIRYYKNIRDQITADGELIDGLIEFNNGFMNQFMYANMLIEADDRSKMDTLGKIVLHLTQYSDFDRQGNIYETMVNSGEIKLLRNQGIVDGLRLLEEKYMYINRMENIHYDAMSNYAIPALKANLKFSNAQIVNPEEVYSYEFQNLVLSLIQVMVEKDKVYKEALNEISVINNLIEEAIIN